MNTTQTEKTGFLRKIMASMGPGIIIAATVFGPGSMLVSAKAGTAAGYGYLWVLVVSAFFMISFTKISATIGCCNNESLLDVLKRHYGAIASTVFGLSCFAICTGFQVGNNINTGIAMNAVFPFMSVNAWLVGSFVLIMLLIWVTHSFYKLLERVMTVLILIMILCFASNVFAFLPDIQPLALASGFIPSKVENWQLIVSMSATTFSIAGAASQSYFVQGKGWKQGELGKAKKDSISGIIILNVITAIILITAATVLPRGSELTSVLGIAGLLEPFFGSMASGLFVFGFFAATFSTVIANAVIGGTFLADTLNLGKSIDDFWVKLFSSLILLMGALCGYFLGSNPVQLTIMAQGATVVGAPLVAIMLTVLCNNKAVVGEENRNSKILNTICVAAILWLCFLAVNQVCLWNGITLA